MKKTASIQDEIREAAARELALEGFSPEAQQDIIASFGAVAIQAATSAILEALPEEKRDAFVDISNKKDETEMRDFLLREVPHYEKIVADAVQEEVRRFKEFLKSTSQ